MASRAYKAIRYLDENFGPINHEETANKDIYVKKHVTFGKTFGRATKDKEQKYIIVGKEGTKITIDKAFFKELRKQGIKNAGQIISAAKEKNPGENTINLKAPKTKLYRDILSVLIIILIVIFGITAFALTDEKDFSDEIVPYVNNDDVELGDFVETDLVIIDGYEITVTTTSTTYGIETGESTDRGNMYLLAVSDLEESDTFIFRYDPKQSRNSQLDEFIKNSRSFEFENVQGKARETGKIEKLDQDEQVTDYFNSVINNLNSELEGDLQNLNPPIYFIDGRYTQGDLQEVIIILSIIGVAAFTCGVSAIILHFRSRKIIAKMVKELLKGQGSIISK